MALIGSSRTRSVADLDPSAIRNTGLLLSLVYFVETRQPDSPDWRIHTENAAFYLSHATAHKVAAELRGCGHPFVRVRPSVAR